jgi:epoxyqueuosine reductase
MLRAISLSGEISPRLYEHYLKGFEYSPPRTLPGARSIFVVASPIGRSIIELDIDAHRLEAIIPPTYGADELIAENEAILLPILGAAGSGIARAWLPLKSIAARTGLGRYGRDTILRFEGAGSFVRLDAWWTELDAEGEYWGPARKLERCATCGACARACPNGCFRPDQFIVDASKCLTFLNEGQGPFPDWLDPGTHHTVVGCLLCQEACPENRNARGNEVYRRFILDREASESLLAGKPLAELPSSAAAAVRAAEMAGDEAKLARNLRALIAASPSRA